MFKCLATIGTAANQYQRGAHTVIQMDQSRHTIIYCRSCCTCRLPSL